MEEEEEMRSVEDIGLDPGYSEVLGFFITVPGKTPR